MTGDRVHGAMIKFNQVDKNCDFVLSMGTLSTVCAAQAYAWAAFLQRELVYIECNMYQKVLPQVIIHFSVQITVFANQRRILLQDDF